MMLATLDRAVDALGAREYAHDDFTPKYTPAEAVEFRRRKQEEKDLYGVRVHNELAMSVRTWQVSIDNARDRIRREYVGVQRVLKMSEFAIRFTAKMLEENMDLLYVYMLIWVNAPEEMTDPRRIVPAPKGCWLWRPDDPLRIRGYRKMWIFAAKVFAENGGEMTLGQFQNEWEYYSAWGETKKEMDLFFSQLDR